MAKQAKKTPQIGQKLVQMDKICSKQAKIGPKTDQNMPKTAKPGQNLPQIGPKRPNLAQNWSK